MYQIKDRVEKLSGVGKSVASKLGVLGISTIRDLLFDFPLGYVDTRNICKIPQLILQKRGLSVLQITNISSRRSFKRKMLLIDAIATDGTNFIKIRWFNQPYILRSVKVGKKYAFYGEVSYYGREIMLRNPVFEEVKSNTEELVHLGKLTPKYHETKGLSSKTIRCLMLQLKPCVRKYKLEYLKDDVLEKYNLIPLQDAIYLIHFPESYEDIEKAQKRLAYDELIQLHININKINKEQKRKGIALKESTKIKEFWQRLPFTLTNAQKLAIKEIFKDVKQNYAMQRLLVGDVGSGKTIVALSVMLLSIINGYSACIMAPTTVLANQHYIKFKKMLKSFDIPIYLATSSNKKQDFDKKRKSIIIGTHALLHRKLPQDTAVVVIDEQHRFGVKQRAKLVSLANKDFSPHYLIMTATPIPRTMAIALYGNIGVSYIDELPKGRLITKTHYVNNKRDKVYNFIRQRIENGHATGDYEQLIVVCPLIEESENLQYKSAINEFNKIQEVFPSFKVALLHGRLKDAEKQEILQKFANNEFDILVTTPVVEVGIDIPNATMMIIESAERFGLAQLHQLRGRVGRRQKQGYCFLFSETSSKEVVARLRFFSKTSNGLKVAKYDLERRGPGEVYGIKQAGFLDLKFASIFDEHMMKAAKDIVDNM